MANKMLIDATHPEETRVVVLRGNRVEEFDFESASRRQLRGNIYLAKVTRVEPSLQAAFIDYGGNRHGFLAFSEIHPDYYQIPVADRQALIDEEERAHRDAEAEADRRAGMRHRPPRRRAAERHSETVASEPIGDDLLEHDSEATANEPGAAPSDIQADTDVGDEPETGRPARGGRIDATAGDPHAAAHPDASAPDEQNLPEVAAGALSDHTITAAHDETPLEAGETAAHPGREETGEIAGADLDAAEEAREDEDGNDQGEPGEGEEEEIVESVGGDDALEEVPDRAPRHRRQYKIQEVIKRRQIMLVQVVKEERGTKGAALTTYLSLAGRYSVLMPNTARGGGISRKITNVLDRRRLKEIAQELEVPEGMGIILRTAGAARTKTEIKRDFEYLLRAWETVRDLTLNSTAPALIYEEGNLIKRSIRDLYTRDIDDVLVEGEEGYRTAKAFMKMLMPSHAKRVQPYRESEISLFHRFQVESQIDAIHAPSVQLRSGGYIVINQTEALVAIDVNSGRSTRERNIEETALRTNLEAAEEIARQLRLRDLAGLIVIDFIDMEEHRNQAAVERRLKEILKNDRARIQVGRISPFGLLEMSRQRLRPSLAEASTQPCPHCAGTGVIRSTESTALYVLRSIEEEAMRRRAAEICVYVPTTVALYILNHKRQSLAQLEARYGFHVLVARDDALIPPAFRLERLRAVGPGETAAPAPLTQPVAEADEGEADAADGADALAIETSAEEVGDDRRRRSRRRRRRRLPGEAGDEAAAEMAEPAGEVVATGRAGDGDGDAGQRRRRGRRGGRRRLRQPGRAPGLADLLPAAETVEILPTPPIAAAPFDGFAPVDAPAAGPSEPAIEPGAEGETADIETASLPALAGDKAASDMDAVARGEFHLPRADQGARPGLAPPAASTIEIVEITAAEAGPAAAPDATAPAPAAAGNGTEQAEALPAWVADGAVGLPQPADAAAQTVTQKPANPRRGWWQRLIQP